MKTLSRQKNNTSNITIELGRIIRSRKKRKSHKAIAACLEQIAKCQQQESELPEEDNAYGNLCDRPGSGHDQLPCADV